MKNLPTQFLTLTLLTAPAIAQAPPQYTAQLVSTASNATAMNDSGTVIGTAPASPANERGWVASPSSPHALLPLPPGRVSSRVYDINAAGVIAGVVSTATYADPNFGGIAAIWTPNGGGYTVQELGKLTGDIGSAATALNNVGDVVGFSQGGMYQRAVWFTAPSGILDLTPTGAFDPRDINDQRMVVCYSTACSRLSLDTMTLENLGTPPGSYSSTTGIAINAANQVAGVAFLSTSTSCIRQAARYSDGMGWETLSACGPNNGTGDINDLGDVTMRAGLLPYVRFEDVGTFSIDNLIFAPLGHWYLYAGSGQINNARQILVAGTNPTTGQNGVLLLTPTAQLGTTLCVGDGSSGSCPCGNASAPGASQGCLHSAASGALLTATGSASVNQDDLVLHVAAAPPGKLALFFQGAPAPAQPFVAGLRCAMNPIVRLGSVLLDATGNGSSSIPIAAGGGVSPGVSRVYQAWFRDPAGPCSSTSNVSAAVLIVWQ